MKKADLWLNVGIYYREDELDLFQEYFKKVGKNRGCYFLDMKQIIAKDLRAQRYKYEEIGKILSCDHATAIRFCDKRIPKDKQKYEEIKLKYVGWIYGNLVPLGVFEAQQNKPFDVKDGFFKLKKVKL